MRDRRYYRLGLVVICIAHAVAFYGQIIGALFTFIGGMMLGLVLASKP